MYQPKAIMVLAAPLLLITLVACGGQGQTSGGDSGIPQIVVPTEVPTQPPSENGEPAAQLRPTDTPQPAEAVVINPCDLVTADETQSALGEAVAGTYQAQFASCTFQASDGTQLVVFVANGQQGKDLMMQGLESEVQYLGNDAAKAALEILKPQVASLSMADLAAGVNGVETALGAQVTEIQGIGDSAFWTTRDAQKVTQITVLRGENAVSLTLVGKDSATGQSLITAIIGNVVSRLPDNFTLAP